MEYDHLISLRTNHPAWRLLRADNAPLVIGFLHHAFIIHNTRSLSEQELASYLDDYLYRVRQAPEDFPRAVREYLTEWAEDTRGWLRRYYPPDSDDPHYDLTPATELVIQWLSGLEQRQFVGAESRLKLVFDLLRQIVEGSEANPQERIKELEKRRADIDKEIDQIHSGKISLLEPTQVRERFFQAKDTAYTLLSDFRQVEQNFRNLDRQIREQITTSEGTKSDILEEIFGAHDNISDSDQGRSFLAFYDFLMSQSRQEEFATLLENIFDMEAIDALRPDARLKRIHHDWLEASEVTQRTIAHLSEQLRRYLDDQAFLENRRIMTIIKNIEKHALAIQENLPKNLVMPLNESSPKIEFPMDRPLFTPPIKPYITQQTLEEGEANISTDILFEQFYVDKNRLRTQIRKALQTHNQIGLSQLLETHPIEQGLAEVVAYFSLAADDGLGIIDEEHTQTIVWADTNGHACQATLPTIIFLPNNGQNTQVTT